MGDEMASKTSGLSVSYDQDWDKFCKWLGIVKKRIASYPPPPSKFVRSMAISDLHIPFHDKEATTNAIEFGIKNKVNKLYVLGDAVDCYSLSRFSKFKTVPIKEEYSEARQFFDYASRSFNEVIVLAGNHEQRERKHFSSRLTSDELDWLLDKPMLQRCTEDMKNVTVHSNIVHGVDMNWVISVGDVVMGHPEKSSANHFVPAETFRKWLSMWGRSVNLNPNPRLVIIGHTHQAGITWSGETMLIENGCLCIPQEYALQPNLYPKPQRLAYTMFDMSNGKVILDSVRQYYPFIN
jgi:predicted phosphodiesterase